MYDGRSSSETGTQRVATLQYYGVDVNCFKILDISTWRKGVFSFHVPSVSISLIPGQTQYGSMQKKGLCILSLEPILGECSILHS